MVSLDVDETMILDFNQEDQYLFEWCAKNKQMLTKTPYLHIIHYLTILTNSKKLF